MISEKQQYDIGEKGPGLAGAMGRGSTGEDGLTGLSGSLGRRKTTGESEPKNLRSSLGRGGKK
jgi:hypothetical protein